MGADLSYVCIGPNTFEFSLTFYRDCSGVASPGSLNINLESQSCGSIPLTVHQVGAGIEVSPLCPSQLNLSSCSSGSLPGVEQYLYKGNYTFTQPCREWTVSFSHCCRNAMISNLVNPASNSLYIFAELDKGLPVCNSSPTFTSLPVPYICANQSFCYNHGALDPDGDSLVYSLVNALSTAPPGGNIAYNAPLNPQYPISTFFGIVTFDANTGSMCVTPNGPQVAVVTIKVEEYRKGLRIGSTMRDLQIVVQNCSNSQPNMASNGMVNVVGATRIDSNSVELCPGQTLGFTMTFTDPDPSDTVSLSSNITSSIPGASFSVSGSNPATAAISWTPGGNDVGLHSFVLQVQDDGCPILGSQVFAFDIRVLGSTYAGPDLTYCPSGSPIQLNPVGGTVFSWDVIAGDSNSLSCTTCPQPLVSPGVPTLYEVISNSNFLCKNRDTLLVNVVPDFTLNMGPDDTICKHGTAPLSATVSPAGMGPYSFSWTSANSLSNALQANPLASPLTTTDYELTAVSSLGCMLKDSVRVVVSGVAPLVSIQALDTICANVATPISVNVTYECDTTQIACSGPGQQASLGLNSGAGADFGPHYMFTTAAYAIRRQYIITADELKAMGFNGGRINAIALSYTSLGSPVNGLRIRMGCVTQDEYLTPPFRFISGLTTVKNPHTQVINNIGWNPISLDYPYYWDGQSNLVIEMCTDVANAGTPSSVAYACSNPAEYRTLTFNLFNGSGVCNQVFGNRSDCRPMMRFDWCEALPPSLSYNWSPFNGLSNSNILNPVLNIDTPGIYSLNVVDGPCAGGDFVQVAVAPAFSLDAGIDTSICQNVPWRMNPSVGGAFGPYSYHWDSVAGMTCTSCANPIVRPLANTNYRLEVRSALGCSMQDSVNITLNGVAPLVDAGFNDTICPNGGIAALQSIVAQDCGIGSAGCSGPLTLRTIGSGNVASATYGPFYMAPSSAFSVRRQYIFTKAELDAMGFSGGGRISQIGMNVSQSGDPVQGLSISMGCTSLSEFETSGQYLSGLDQVKSPHSHSPISGWNMISLDNPYTWDGQSNLVVEFCTNTLNAGNPSSLNYTCLGTGAQRCLYISVINNSSACLLPAGLRSDCRPDFRFETCVSQASGLSFSWSPGASLSAVQIPNPIANPSQTTTYTLTVSDGGVCEGMDWVTVAVDSQVYVAVTANDLNPCQGEVVNLSAFVSGVPLANGPASCGVNNTSPTQAIQTFALGTGSLNSPVYPPFYGTFNDVKVQYLYRAADLRAAGMGSGTITDLSWDLVAKISNGTFQNFRIALGCTSDSALAPANGWLATQGVWGPRNYITGVGANNFALDNSYDWDGISNLIIEVCYDNPNGANIGSDMGPYVFTSYPSLMRAFSSGNGANGCSLAPMMVNFALPNLEIGYAPPPPPSFNFSWSPASHFGNPTIPNPAITFNGLPTTYTVEVSGGPCVVRDTVTISNCSPLPADRLELTAKSQDGQADLTWITVNELNTESFHLERSQDGLLFTEINHQTAAGNSRGALSYSYQDLFPEAGRNYYRVRLRDQDGFESLSNQVELSFAGVNGLLRIFPNPLFQNQSLRIDYRAAGEGELELAMFDLLGRKVFEEIRELKQGRNSWDLETKGLGKGTYILQFKNGTKVENRKVLIE